MSESIEVLESSPSVEEMEKRLNPERYAKAQALKATIEEQAKQATEGAKSAFVQPWVKPCMFKGDVISTGISEDINAPLPEPLNLKEFFWGKRIAIVGNGVPEKDYSAEIDSADVVVRFNNFYNIKSGKVGRKLDFLVITPSSYWHDNLKDGERGEAEIQKQKPIVCFVRHEARARWKKFIEVFKGLKIFRAVGINMFYQTFTTGGAFLAWAADHFQNCEIKAYGFGDVAGFTNYLNRQGRHYLPICEKEKNVRDVSLEVISRKRIFTGMTFKEWQNRKASEDDEKL